MLARRHPDALPATRVTAWTALPWALALAGHRRAALGAAMVETLLIGGKLRRLTGRPNRLAGALVARGLLATGLGLAQAARRAWAPPLCLLACKRPSARRVLLAAFAAPVAQDALATRAPRAALGDARSGSSTRPSHSPARGKGASRSARFGPSPSRGASRRPAGLRSSIDRLLVPLQRSG